VPGVVRSKAPLTSRDRLWWGEVLGHTAPRAGKIGMNYADRPEVLPQRGRTKRHNFWPLVVPVACAVVWLVPVGALFGAHTALYCGILAAAGAGAVGLLALLPVAEGLDTLGVGH